MYQVFKANNGIKLAKVPAPVAGDMEILVKTEISLISTGTETASLKKKEKGIMESLHESVIRIQKVKDKIVDEGLNSTFKKVMSKFSHAESELKLNPIGYSAAGTVIAVGKNVKGFNIGDSVACAGSGIAAHAEYIRIPVNLAVKYNPTIPKEAACFATVGSIALHGIRRADVKPGEIIVILGLGLIGQLAVQIAKAWGLIVIGIDLLEQRVRLARNNGCDLGLIADDPKVEEKVKNFSSGYGADTVVICAATLSSEPALLAMRLCKQRGRVVLVGSVGLNLDRDLMYKKELDFVISTSYGPGRYDNEYEVQGRDYPYAHVRWTENRNMQEFVRLLAERKVDTVSLISNKFHISEAKTAFEQLVSNPIDNLAVLLTYQSNESVLEKIPDHVVELKNYSSPKGILNTAIIGAGGFAQRTHLPNLSSLNQYFNIYALVDRKPEIASQIGKKFDATIVSTDANVVFNDPNVDLVVITTQHNLHADLVLRALRSGKHVLVEKPLAINRNQFVEIENELKHNSISKLFVGFNRRYSSLIQKVKKVLGGHGPLLISYRVNAGFISQNHWIQNPLIGGGRLIGEVCHFIDLISYIVESPVKGFHISSIPVDRDYIQSLDNFIVVLTFENGSIGQITYTSIGSKSLSKELIEIHTNGKSILIEDFVQLKFFGFDFRDEVLSEVDKGHQAELMEIYKCINGKSNLIPEVGQDLLATELSIRMLEELLEESTEIIHQ